MIQEEEIVELFRHYNGGRFDVKKILGIGGMGIVVQAFDKKLKVLRAIKIFNPELLSHESLIRRFENEASIMAGIDHPNIVRVYDVGEVGIYHYMVLEWIDGGSLGSLIQPIDNPDGTQILRPMHSRVALEMIYRVCDALAFAHKRGIIHRDMKPDNILITKEGIPKVTDFGIAHMDDDQKKRVTSTGESIGTSGYTSPQQWSNFALTDARDDIYSVAVTFWALMTGLRPPSVLFFHDIESQPELLDAIPFCLRPVLKKAVSYSSSARYQSMEEFASALRAVEEHLPPLGGAVIVSVSVDDHVSVTDQTAVGATRIASKPVVAELVEPTRVGSKQPTEPVPEPTRVAQKTPPPERDGDTLAYRQSGEAASPDLPVMVIGPDPVTQEEVSVVNAVEALKPPQHIETERVTERNRRRMFVVSVSALCVIGLSIFFWAQSQSVKVPVPEQTVVALVVPETISPPVVVSEPDVSIAVDVSAVDLVSKSEPDIPTVVVQIPDEQAELKTNVGVPLVGTHDKQEKKDRKGTKTPKSIVVKAGETLLLKPDVPKPPVVEPTQPKLETAKVQIGLKIQSDDTVRVWLVGPGGRHKMPGSVAPGTYKVVALFKDQDTETDALSKLVVTEGVSLQLKCDSAREVCWKL